MRIVLSLRVTALSVVLVASAGALVGGLVLYGSQRLLMEQAMEGFAVDGRLLLAELADDVERLRLGALFFAGTPPVAGILRARQADGVDPRDGTTGTQWSRQLAETFARRMSYSPHYLQMRLLSPGGRELVRVERTADGVHTVTGDALQDKGHRDYLRATLEIAPGETHFSRIDLNRERGRIEEPHVPTLRVATPVPRPGGGAVGAVLVINLDLRPFFAHLAELESLSANARRIYLVDGAGDYLYHRDPTLRFGFDLGRRHRIQELIPELATFLSGDTTETARRVRGLPETLAVHAVKAALDPGGPQRIVALVQTAPYAAVVAGALELRTRSLWLTACLVLAGALLAVLSARYVTRPLRLMTRAVQGVAAGDFRHQPLAPCCGELEVLAQALNEMADAVASREQALADERTRLAAIIGTAVDAVILIDDRGTILQCNPACERLFGYTPEELVGENVKRLMPEPYHSRHDGYLRRYREGGGAQVVGIGRDVLGRRRDGSTFPMYLSVGEAWEGERRLFVGILHDTSDYHAALAQIRRQAQELERSNRDLSDFAFVASHDLQEPLRKVISFGQILGSEHAGQLDAEGREFLGYMVSGAERMSALLKGLLAYSRVSTRAQPFERVDLKPILDQVTADLSLQVEESGAQLEVGEVPVVQADPVQIRQLFQNLVSNALKFRDPERPLRVALAGRRFPDADGSPLGRPAWQVEVADNGIGIPEEERETVFQPFKRLHGRDRYPGTGLGLAVCAKIAARHGGRIELESEPDAGSRFRVILPDDPGQLSG